MSNNSDIELTERQQGSSAPQYQGNQHAGTGPMYDGPFREGDHSQRHFSPSQVINIRGESKWIWGIVGLSLVAAVVVAAWYASQHPSETQQ